MNFLTYLLQNREEYNRVMIFTRTKTVANNVFNFVDEKGLGPVKVIHSNKGQNSRINAINEFKEGKVRILVSTDVTARGIDVTKVSHVINFDVPVLYEDYVHRIGRTGRAFQEGKAITFATVAEIYHVEKIEKLIREKIPLKDIPTEVEITKTSYSEAQAMSLDMDWQKKREDPEFKGAFHEKKKKGASSGRRSQR
jgi:ATP-dependent RNA helicase RhlE